MTAQFILLPYGSIDWLGSFVIGKFVLYFSIRIISLFICKLFVTLFVWFQKINNKIVKAIHHAKEKIVTGRNRRLFVWTARWLIWNIWLEYEDDNLESETTSFFPRTGSSDEAPSIHAVLNRVRHQIQSLKHLLMIM